MGASHYRGIILSGGSGTRLSPVTTVVSKGLLPVYSKPMIYYPLSVLMLAGVREILIISTPHDTARYEELLGNGEQFGVNFQYAVQPRPEGIAQAFLIAREFIGEQNCCLILGDNIFYGHDLTTQVRRVARIQRGATVFGYAVNDPERYGVVEFDDLGRAVSLEEKPRHPRSRYAVTGLYFYDNRVVSIAESLRPSGRGELEITDVNRVYLERGELDVVVLGRGMAWLDTGTYESLMDASSFIQSVEKRQGMMVACPEEIAFRSGFITADVLEQRAHCMKNSMYGSYLLEIAREPHPVKAAPDNTRRIAPKIFAGERTSTLA